MLILATLQYCKKWPEKVAKRSFIKEYSFHTDSESATVHHSLKLQTLMAWKRYILHIGHDEEVYWEIKIMFHGYEN